MNLDTQFIQFALIVFIMVIAFIFEIAAMEVVALGAVGLLLVFNIISIEEAISGFSNKAVITIGAIFIISNSLVKTGFLEVLADFLYKMAGDKKWVAFFIFFITVSLISGLINNTAAVAIFIPLAINLCQKFHISPTKILLPLSYAAIYGGTLTLIGTSTNLIINSYIEDNTSITPFAMFEFFKLGIIFLVIGTGYNFLISKWILPSRAAVASLTQKYHMNTYLTEFQIPANSKVIGKSINDLNFKNKIKFDIVKLIRNKTGLTINIEDSPLLEKDVLLVQINVKDIVKLKEALDAHLLSDVKMSQTELVGNNHVLVEGLIVQGSLVIGKTLRTLDFRRNYSSFVLAIKRQTELLREKVAHVRLKFSDTLLILVPRDKLDLLRKSNQFIILEELDIQLKYERYWWLSIIVIPLIMILASLNIISITKAVFMGCILLLVLKTVTIEEAYKSINWSIIFLIALLIPVGTAMSNTGAAEIISRFILSYSSSLTEDVYLQAYYVVSILFCLTFILSAFISNAAVAIILSPLAIMIAQHFQTIDPLVTIDPTKAFLMAICFGASTSFMTPMGYQTNLMVFAPGQYKFRDFLIVGLPITIIFWIIASYLIPIFWPF